MGWAFFRELFSTFRNLLTPFFKSFKTIYLANRSYFFFILWSEYIRGTSKLNIFKFLKIDLALICTLDHPINVARLSVDWHKMYCKEESENRFDERIYSLYHVLFFFFYINFFFNSNHFFYFIHSRFDCLYLTWFTRVTKNKMNTENLNSIAKFVLWLKGLTNYLNSILILSL